MSLAIQLAETGWLPLSLERIGIRRLLKARTDMSYQGDAAYADQLRAQPIAIEQQAANDQHYEVPAVFYEHVLGKHLKYSSAYYISDSQSLEEAEATMLELSCERAELIDGQDILELGCGWGSLTCWMADHYPNSRITAVSNSASQKAHIESRLKKLGRDNVTIVTADLAKWHTDQQFDRIVSVECFEHMRNYEQLFAKVRTWLRAEGQVFLHVFCHKTFGYLFEEEGEENWMGRNFFTGGQMPSFNLFQQFNNDLQVDQQWEVNGSHYERTARDWRENLYKFRNNLETLFPNLPAAEQRRNYHRWRLFFLACEETFGAAAGKEWFVGHYRLKPA
jgi:cyclopropane-fatty-acyl-phospholipid synthase